MRRGELNKKEMDELKKLLKEDEKKTFDETLKEIRRAREDVKFGAEYKKRKRRQHFLFNKLNDVYA